LLELDDLAGADVAIETLERLTTEARDRRAAAYVPLHRARRVTIEGRFEEARNLLAEVAAISAEMPSTTIPITVDGQLVVLNWVQQGPRAIGDEVRGYADGVPAMPVWRAALAASFADRGRAAEAQLELDRLAADDFAALPRDNLWFGTMAALAEAVAALGLRERALELHAKLAPFAGRNVVTPTAAFLGPIEMWLGILARVGGRGEQALEHLLRARTSATRNGSRMILARIDVEEAEVLAAAGGAGAGARAEQLVAQAAVECAEMGLSSLLEQIERLRERLPGSATAPPVGEPARASLPAGAGAGVPTLRRTGDVWTLDDGRKALHLADGRGVRLLALLLDHPGEEIHSLDLVAIVDGTTRAGAARWSGGQETAGRYGIQGGAGPTLDARAKESYRARIEALRTEIAEAEALGDEARASRARAELEFVSRELELAVGIGGRDRESGSHAERARVNVTRAIRATLKRIAGYDARLGHELAGSVRTGTFCVYEPGPRRPP
ncbi:MAG: hypothetical protein QOJ63_532, partial [Solirubrobacteraceae bacterium]|nr:hypothetical protein [Solirubrobacteraceae bacterium]